MPCPRCRHENPAGQKFCGECGARLASACAGCGAVNPAGQKFCGECGAPLAAPASPAKFASPASYTPSHLAERILTSKRALPGERKQITVLFADMKGSMEVMADRDPEEARTILDPVLQHMMDAVHGYEGTVNQVMGDGIMALFGAPVAQEDHAVRACYAALRMQDSVKRHAEEIRRREGILPQIRVGVNSGEVVVRSVGSDLRMDYTAVGQTTHLAARMEQMAAAGSILIAAETLRLTEGYVDVKPLGPVSVKGLDTPIGAWELLGASAARTRLQAASARGLTPFVGRVAELESLRRALDGARAGHGQIVAMVGEPGVGKSRLFREFTHSQRTGGWLVIESGAVPYGPASRDLAVVDLLAAYFEIHGRDDRRQIREKVTGKLLALDRTLEPSLPALLALLGAPVEDPQWQDLDPHERRQRTLDAVKRLLLRESQVQPLLLVFEDLQWIDSETQTVLDGLVDSLPTARVLLLVNYRPEYQHGWGSRTYYRQLSVDPLPTANSDELLESLLGSDASLAPLEGLLIERTEGNPFFIEENVRELIETAVLVGEPGRYRLPKAPERIAMPASVHAVLAARIDRLPASDKALLQTASVIGKDVPAGLLQAVAAIDEASLRAALARLQAAEFLYEARIFPDLEYTFKHALTFEVAYGSLLHEHRRGLHARVLEALEQASPRHPAERVEILAHHAVCGERWTEAARYLYLAGERAVAGARYSAAASFYEATAQAIDRQPTPDRSLKLDVYLGLWVARIESGDAGDLAALAEQAEALALSLDDHARLAQVRLRQAQAYRAWSEGTLDHAIELAGEAFMLADPSDLRTRSYARNLRALYYRDVGRLQDAIREFDAAADLPGRAAPGHEASALVMPIYVTIRSLQAETYASLGDFERALAAGRDALGMAERIGHLPSQGLAYAHLGYVSVQRGDVDAGMSLLRRGLALGEDNGFIHATLASGFFLAHALAVVFGRHEEALPRLERALKAVKPGYPMEVLWSKYGGLTASVYVASGRFAEAHAEIDRALSLVARRGALGHRAYLLCLQARLIADAGSGSPRDAVRRWEEAMTLATELGMRPLVAHCHADLAHHYRRAKQHKAADTHLATAIAMYRQMQMRFWRDRAEASERA
jgi:class 3 adenylate cyclase/tetratricopeptide (TPR) repeat protein